MLRSIDFLKTSAEPHAVLADRAGQIALKGGSGGYAMPWHWHDCVMLLLPVVGSLDLQHEDRREGVWVSEDRLAIVPADRAHQTRAHRHAHLHVALYVTAAVLKTIEVEVGSLSRLRSGMARTSVFQASPDIRAIRALCLGGDAGQIGRPVRDHLAAALLMTCLTTMERSDPLPASSHREHGAALVSEVQSFLSTRVNQDVPIDAIADRFGLSRRHITRLFRDRTGQSLGDFVQAARVKAAGQLLTDTDLPVGEVAYRVGYESGSALSRAMRRLDGRSPTDVRNSMARSVKP